VKIFNWLATMAQGSNRYNTAMLFAIALVGLFTIGGISGIMHSSPPADLQQTDTYYIVAHFHYVLFGGSIMGIFAGIYHYFPKMFGRMMSEKLGSWHFWLNFIAMNLTFFPMHFSGLLGMPRRIYTYDAGQGWDTFNRISTIGAYMLVLSTAIFVWNFFRSRTNGAPAPDNPWDAATLEWSIPSPPPEYNFAEIPLVESRYPLWDLTHPERTSEIPHTHDGWSDQEKAADAKPVHIERDRRTAKELGIPMPTPTIKPLFVAAGIIVMLSGLIFIHKDDKTVAAALIALGATMIVGFLYAWVTSPLEPEHH